MEKTIKKSEVMLFMLRPSREKKTTRGLNSRTMSRARAVSEEVLTHRETAMPQNGVAKELLLQAD